MNMPIISGGSISKDKGKRGASTYQEYRLAILSRLRLGIQIVVRIAVENRGFVGDARVPRGIDWWDGHDAMQRFASLFLGGQRSIIVVVVHGGVNADVAVKIR
jgi:hypothetical protein